MDRLQIVSDGSPGLTQILKLTARARTREFSLVEEAQQIEHDEEHEHDSPTSESGLKELALAVWRALKT
jgi:hypothetical protein